MKLEFNNACDAIDYITENNLLSIPVNLELKLDAKPKVQVWFGDIEFWKLQGTSNHIAIVHHIYEKAMMDLKLEEIEEYCVDSAFRDWIIPSEFDGEIVYSSHYLKELTK